MNPTSIRLPKELEERIKEDAKRSKRSVSKQIEWIIETYYSMKDKTSE